MPLRMPGKKHYKTMRYLCRTNKKEYKRMQGLKNNKSTKKRNVVNNLYIPMAYTFLIYSLN